MTMISKRAFLGGVGLAGLGALLGFGGGGTESPAAAFPVSLTPQQWRAFVATLAPLRASGVRQVTPGHAECGSVITDQPSVTVRWSGSSQDRLDYYYGCRGPANQALGETLRAAPSLLPIGDFIGPRG